MQERAPFNLAFMTDLERLPNQMAILGALPHGTAVIFRDYDHPNRYETAKVYRELCRQNGLLFIVGGDANLARSVEADGLHLPSHQLSDAPDTDVKGFISCACHTATDLSHAGQLGADIAFLSPVFVTASHPKTTPLGPTNFKKLAHQSALPLLALGGVTEKNATQLYHKNVVGFGAIGAFSSM